MHADVIRLYQTISQPLFGVGIEAVSALDAAESGYPGFSGMDIVPEALSHERKYFFHFPDGNASVARLLVRKLIPESMPGNSATDVVTARANYAKLDEKGSPLRIRLNSTAVRVRHLGDPARATEVEVAYARGGKVYMVRAKHAVLACWNMMIPYLCEDLPDTQKEALAFATKVPLLYTNVLLRNWTAFQKLGANSIYAPGGYHTHVDLDLPVSIGEYRCPRTPDEPTVVHMSKSPCRAGRPARIDTPPAASNSTTRLLKPWSARFANSCSGPLGRAVLILHATSWPSQSTAGLTDTLMSTAASGTSLCWKAVSRRVSARASLSDGSPSRTLTPALSLIQMRPSIRLGGPWGS